MLLTLGAVSLSVVGTILGTVGWWAPALVSTHQVPAAPCPKAWQRRILQTVPATPWGIKSAPVENLCTAEWPLLTGWEFAQYREPRKMQALSSVWGTAASDYIWPQRPKPCLLCPVRSLLKRPNFDMCLHHARTNIEAVLHASQRHLWKWLTSLTPCLTPRDTVQSLQTPPNLVIWVSHCKPEHECYMSVACTLNKIHLKYKSMHQDGDSYLWFCMASLSVSPLRNILASYTMDRVVNRGLYVKLLFFLYLIIW